MHFLWFVAITAVLLSPQFWRFVTSCLAGLGWFAVAVVVIGGFTGGVRFVCDSIAGRELNYMPLAYIFVALVVIGWLVLSFWDEFPDRAQTQQVKEQAEERARRAAAEKARPRDKNGRYLKANAGCP